ncbi:hypothetical protein scyTo_0019338 [Scyliorhinus torazame]|uniref:Ig-like domain-containing protein n=1 Tax=Scyliorhinus torazame TaxID=75743 RepID=A0A401PXS8_SCYTO|nr:hypothetical protein [Scyliorhinus torazame]
MTQYLAKPVLQVFCIPVRMKLSWFPTQYTHTHAQTGAHQRPCQYHVAAPSGLQLLTQARRLGGTVWISLSLQRDNSTQNTRSCQPRHPQTGKAERELHPDTPRVLTRSKAAGQNTTTNRRQLTSFMGKVTRDYLPCLFFLIVPYFCPCYGAEKVTITVDRNLVQTGVGWNTTLSVANGSELYSVVWQDQVGGNILTLLNGVLTIKPGTVYTDRVSLQPNNSLMIRSTRQADEGTYTVTMDPPGGVDLMVNTAVLALEVYVPITNVSITLSPNEVFEGVAEVVLRCTVISGSSVTFSWSKGNSNLFNSSRITVTNNIVRIQTLSRDDSGSYTCTARNPISTNSNSQLLTVFYGPEAAVIRRDFQSDCVVPDQVLPWMSEYPKVERGIAPTPIYSADRLSIYSHYPPSNGSMVASTIDGGVSTFSVQTDRSGQLSTLV